MAFHTSHVLEPFCAIRRISHEAATGFELDRKVATYG
jgi:hypothetical protein